MESYLSCFAVTTTAQGLRHCLGSVHWARHWWRFSRRPRPGTRIGHLHACNSEPEGWYTLFCAQRPKVRLCRMQALVEDSQTWQRPVDRLAILLGVSGTGPGSKMFCSCRPFISKVELPSDSPSLLCVDFLETSPVYCRKSMYELPNQG